jgi:oxygen-dependent protoporphyrinogen oxidase
LRCQGFFSPLGKLRAAGDFILPKGKEKTDQSLGEFFRRRLGDEIVDNLIDPLLSGIYAGDIDRLSLMSLFPMFYHMEQKHRSLVLGLKKTMPAPPKTAKKEPSKKLSSVTLINLAASEEILPTAMVLAASPWYPFNMAPQSITCLLQVKT